MVVVCIVLSFARTLSLSYYYKLKQNPTRIHAQAQAHTYWILFDFWLCFLCLSFYVSEIRNPFRLAVGKLSEILLQLQRMELFNDSKQQSIDKHTHSFARSHTHSHNTLIRFSNATSQFTVGAEEWEDKPTSNEQWIDSNWMCRCVRCSHLELKWTKHTHTHRCCLFTFKITMNVIKHASNSDVVRIQMAPNHLRSWLYLCDLSFKSQMETLIFGGMWELKSKHKIDHCKIVFRWTLIRFLAIEKGARKKPTTITIPWNSNYIYQPFEVISMIQLPICVYTIRVKVDE